MTRLLHWLHRTLWTLATGRMPDEFEGRDKG
jgi:hypothetical protein